MPPETLPEIFPPFGLRIDCGPLSLRAMREADVVELAAAVHEHGIYDPQAMVPFLSPWPEAGDAVAINALQFYWRQWAEFSPETWHLVLRVEHEGEFVGAQDVFTTSPFAATRELTTGSWLLRHRQGRGLGTLMRQAVCAFAFDELGAEVMVSEAILGNEASLGVSRRVGYRPNGLRRRANPRAPGWLDHQLVRLTPEGFVRPPHPVVVTGGAAFRRFVGLDAEGVTSPGC